MNILSGVLEASPDAVLVVDEAGVIQQANRNVPKVLGYSPSELEGKMVESLLLEEDRQHHVRFRQEYMEDPEPRPMGRELDLYALHKDGTDVPVEISLGPVERDGRLCVVATITDITKRKEREREFQRQNERLEEFASVVSHDLRNPLNVAMGRLELARRKCDSDYLDDVARAHDRMDTLIDDILTIAREGKRTDETEVIDLADTIDGCWRTVETADATLVTETERMVRADPSRLKQLLENLFRNAVEHGRKDVTVTVGDLDDGFYVADNGHGIPETEREQVFEAGYSTADEGTGFGLNIVQEIADAHGCDISVTESEDGGARFEITGVEFADC